jgi:MFS family permease
MNIPVAGVLKQRNFILYFLSETITMFGSGMLFIGINWYVRQASGSNAAVGLVMSLSILSSLLIFPLSGTAADRFPRRSALLVLNLCRALVFASFLLPAALGRLDFHLIYLLVVLNGVGSAFHTPIAHSFLQEILDRENLVAGNALIEMSLQAGLFVSAGFTGIVLQLAGMPLVLAVGTGTYLIGALLLLGIGYTPLEVRDAVEGFFVQFGRGLRYLLSRPRLLLLGVVMQAPFLVVIVSNVVLPGYIQNRLQAGAVTFGLADGTYGLAAFCASLLLSLFAGKLPRFALLAALFAAAILALGGLYLNRFLVGLYLGLFLFGLANTPLKILVTSTLMELVEKQQFGRAMAFWNGVSALLQVTLSFALGSLLDVVPENNGYLVLAAVAACGLAGLAALFPRRPARRPASARSA